MSDSLPYSPQLPEAQTIPQLLKNISKEEELFDFIVKNPNRSDIFVSNLIMAFFSDSGVALDFLRRYKDSAPELTKRRFYALAAQICSQDTSSFSRFAIDDLLSGRILDSREGRD